MRQVGFTYGRFSNTDDGVKELRAAQLPRISVLRYSTLNPQESCSFQREEFTESTCEWYMSKKAPGWQGRKGVVYPSGSGIPIVPTVSPAAAVEHKPLVLFVPSFEAPKKPWLEVLKTVPLVGKGRHSKGLVFAISSAGVACLPCPSYTANFTLVS
ncbi:hypothetical protein TREES_T100010049 [Tupaia chinensis]|uniref:Uncharacterized protein n=1 Tax=Tupaia chinensis TaxID=246437 RepID=L9KMM5_TUPCH|nr:hypothetical protein TREES_T100010049 [Tupaia chinensis]